MKSTFRTLYLSVRLDNGDEVCFNVGMSEHYEVSSSPESPEQLPPMVVLPEQISADALAGVIESFIFRDGTDYGAVEASCEVKVAHILKQIDRGEVLITFDPNTESVSLITKSEWRKIRS